MGNYIKVKPPIVEGKKIINSFEVEGSWKHFFRQGNMTVEYNIPLSSDLPASIAVIPLVSMLLPLVWICDATLTVNELDKDFYDGLPDVKRGYSDMYPHIDFGGKIQSRKLIKNQSEQEKTKTALFFSAGVDAFNSLVSHADEKLTLLTVWGADVSLNDTQGWENVRKTVKKAAKEFNVDSIIIKSDFRRVIKEEAVSRFLKRPHAWWHDFEHSVGLFGLAAVMAYELKFRNIYIASTYTADSIGKYTCASDPTIDNYVKFCGTHIVHDGYEFSRQDKVRRICNYSREHNRPIELHVCYESEGGRNCCKCEKCYGTALAIVSEGFDPEDFGFTWGSEEILECKKRMMKRIKIKPFNLILRMYPVVDKMKENPEQFKEYQWLMDIDWNTFNQGFSKWWYNSIFYWVLKKIYDKVLH